MTFTVPLALVALIPWAAVTLYVLWGRARRMDVPFVQLWQGAEPRSRAAQGIRVPPLALLAMLLATLLALVAIAGPRVRARGGGGGHVTILVDRGLTMSGMSGGRTRYVAAAESIASRITAGARVDIVDLTTGETIESAGSDWLQRVRQLKRTGIAATAAGIRTAALDARARQSNAADFVLTDQQLDLPSDRRIEVVGPATPLADVAITQFAARDGASPQAMVELSSTLKAARTVDVRVTAGQQRATQRVDLPAGGTARTFIDLPALADAVSAELLDQTDDVSADDVAYLVRQGAAPRVEARSGLPPALARVIDAFGKSRPPSDGSPAVTVTARRVDVAPGELAAIFEGGGGEALRGEPRVVAHPVTASVDWTAVLKTATAARVAAPDGFQAIVTVGDRAVVAVRESPSRQVWVAFDAPEFRASVDYVVFWSNVFNWAGGDAIAVAFTTAPVAWAPASWTPTVAVPADADARAWPNLFRRPGGRMEPMSVVDAAAPRASHVASAPPPLLSPPIDATRDLRQVMLTAACACVVLSAVTCRCRAR